MSEWSVDYLARNLQEQRERAERAEAALANARWALDSMTALLAAANAEIIALKARIGDR